MFGHADGFLTYLSLGVTVGIALLAAGHAILYKRDPRAAAAWVGFILLLPVVGTVLYVLLGINRIRRTATAFRSELDRYQKSPEVAPLSSEDVETFLPDRTRHLKSLSQLVERVTGRPLLPGNQVVPYLNGDTAYPAMLEAIENAKHSVTLCTYIFEDDRVGQTFAEALGAAFRRGVDVRVIIDDIGARYSRPPIDEALHREGVPVARFLPVLKFWRPAFLNLRNHRKILVVDGCLGFTGGMNIRSGHQIASSPPFPIQDLHFRVEGPSVAHLQEAFAEDWQFCTEEALRGSQWFPPLHKVGPVAVRGILDGPDADVDKLRWTILGALACARSSVKIVTPYFLPDREIISALNVAAMRGVAIDILLPSRNNLPIVQWASQAMLWQTLEHGCRVWLTPPPFDHSKLMLVDDYWALIGSSNWDPRTLRLNFEFNLECYGDNLASQLNEIFGLKLNAAQALTQEMLNQRSVPVKFRDGIARLFIPYL